MTLLGFKELVSDGVGHKRRELESILDINLITSSRENYLLYLQWLAHIWVYLETQIEASPLADREDFDLASRLRSPLLVSDCDSLLDSMEPFAAPLISDIKVFDNTPSLGEAAGVHYAMEELQLDHREIRRRLSSIGIRGKTVTQFYRGNDWLRSWRNEKLAIWINKALTARERTEAVEGAFLTYESFVKHFSSLNSVLTAPPTSAASHRSGGYFAEPG